MSALKIALLGPPEVDHRDHWLTLPDRKALALLAYLATEGGVHERQKLTRLLWPESDMAHGRTVLRITLLHLRHILEEEASLECEAHLLITHDTIGLDLSSGIDLDLHALENAWKLVRVLPGPEAVEGEVRHALITQLYRAATLYRGSFLQDFTLRNTLDFDNWVGMQQGYWYQRIEQVFDWLSQLQSAEGALEQAIETVERWRSFDPLNEDISLRLMELQFATGDRIAALKTYETCVEVLMTELSAKPSRKLVALAEVLRNASPPRVAHSGVGRCTSTARPVLDVPFVGRGAEFSRLMRLYEQAFRGQPQVVLLEGEAGIGKTRLAAAFLNWVRAQGADVLEGRAFQTSQRLSYQPLIEALRTRLEQEPDLRQWLGDPWLAELSRLLPDLRERYPDLPRRVPVSCPILDGARDARPVAAEQVHRNTGNGAGDVRMACEPQQYHLFDAPGTVFPLLDGHPPDRSRTRVCRRSTTIMPGRTCSLSAFILARPGLRKRHLPGAFRRVAVRRNQRAAVLPARTASGTTRTRRPGSPLDRGKRLGI